MYRGVHALTKAKNYFGIGISSTLPSLEMKMLEIDTNDKRESRL